MVDDPNVNDPMRRLRAGQTPERRRKADLMAGIHRAYMPTTRDEDLSREIDALIDGQIMAIDAAAAGHGGGRSSEGQILCAVGQSGTGKTRSLERCFERPEFSGYRERGSGSLLRSVVAPSPGTSKQVAITVLTALDYESRRQIQENPAWALVRHHLRLSGVRFLHIDEAQHLIQTPSEWEIQKIQDTLKSLVQQPDWPVSLILSGTQPLADLLEGDTQLRRRCRFVRFDALHPTRDARIVHHVVRAYCERAKLDLDGALATKDGARMSDEVVGRLLHAATYALGLLIEIVQDALGEAVAAGSRSLQIGHLADVYRRRSGCGAERNVLLVEHWRSIDVASAIYPERADVEEDDEKPRSRRRGGRR